MAKTAILKPFLAIAKDRMTMNTIADLEASQEYIEGDIVQVLGEITAGDGKHHMRIASTVADSTGIQGQGGLFWNVVPNSLISLITQAIEQNKSDILSINDEKWKLFSNISISTDTNLNNIVENGVYQLLEGVSNTLLNMPSGLQGLNQPHTLIVTSNGDYYRQTLLAYGGQVYHRNYIFGNGSLVWKEWAEGYNSDNCPISKNRIGWCKLANGLIMQWGKSTITPNAHQVVNFPVVFSQYPSVTVSRNYAWHAPGQIMSPTVNENFSFFDLRTPNATSNPDKSDTYSWMAIGY